MAVNNTPLKRLGWVHSAVQSASGYTYTAEKLYASTKSYVPAFAKPALAKVEDTVVSITAPVLTVASDTAEKALVMADSQVDFLLSTAEGTLSTGRKLHEQNMKVYADATTQYYDYVKGIADWAKDKLNPVKGGQAALDALHAALDKAIEATDPDVGAKLAVDAWNKFASVPVVAKVLDTADPVIKPVLGSFYKLHDGLVTLPLYKTAVDTSSSTLNWATSTTPYKLGAQYIYPVVQPVADPALARLTNSMVIKKTVDFWRPASARAA